MNRLLFLLSGFLCILSKAESQNMVQKIPKVAIGIVIENMRPDYIDRFWNKFGDDGFKKLIIEGTSCTDFRIDPLIQNNASATATLFSGVTPSLHGIIGLNWYDRKKGKVINCVTDDRYKLTGNNAVNVGISPCQLQSTTLIEQLKLFTNGKSKIFSIAMNAVPAVFSAGFSGDAAFWFDEVSGNMITSSFYKSKLPEWVDQFNRQNLAKKYSERNWALLKSLQDYSESNPDNDSLEIGYGQGQNVFPHNLSELVRRAGNYAPLKTTPYANSIVTAFFLELIANESIGMDNNPDLVTLFFSSMDKEQASFGPGSVEMEDLYLRTDQEMAAIIGEIEKRYGKENVLVFLTANTSASYPANYMQTKFRIPCGTFSPESAFALLNSYLNLTFGDLRWIEYFDGFQVYLNHRLIDLNKVDLKNIRSKTADFLTQFEGIQQTVTADQIEQGQISTRPWNGIPENYNPSRSGDVMYKLKECWQPATISDQAYISGSPCVPLVFYGTGIAHRIISTPCECTDLAPTISKILGIPKPLQSSGRIIEGF
jgi:hypothetical protein